MLVLRFASVVLAALLIGIIAIDVALYRDQSGPVLEYQKGVYLGQTDTAISEEKARRDTESPFMWFKRTGQEVGAPPEHRVELLPEEFGDYRRRFSRETTFDYNAMFDNVALFGTPGQVAERIEVLRKSGVENLIFFVNYGGIESRKVLDSLELFANQVMPLFPEDH